MIIKTTQSYNYVKKGKDKFLPQIIYIIIKTTQAYKSRKKGKDKFLPRLYI